jgi:hypothetical protein
MLHANLATITREVETALRRAHLLAQESREPEQVERVAREL